MTDATTVRARALDGFSETITELGGQPDRVLRQAGLSPSMIDKPEAWIPFGAVLAAYEQASKSTRCPHFGMYLAAKRDLSFLGPLLHIFKYSENLRNGLESVAQYSGVQNSGYSISIITDGDCVAFRFVVPMPLRATADQWIEESIATTLKALRLFLGESYMPRGVRLAHEAVGEPGRYLTYLGVMPEFGAPEDALIFEVEALTVSNPRTDWDLVRFLGSYLDTKIPETTDDIAETVQSLLLELIPTGKYSIDVIADQLNIHRRTLQRRLTAAGVRYADLLDSCREKLAAEYLQENSLPIVNLAHLLGYSDQSAFNHAFRRWHGLSPKVWAKRNRSQAE